MIFLNIWNAEALESPCAALSAGCIARRRGAVECRLADGGGVKLYSFVVQTNSGMGCKPIVVHESTNSGRW